MGTDLDEGLLDVQKEVKELFGEEAYGETLARLEHTNSGFQEGYFVADENANLAFTEKIVEETTDAIISVQGNTVYSGRMARSGYIPAGGVDKYENYWWGSKLYLSDSTSRKVCAGGSFAATIVALFGTVATTVIAVITEATVASISWKNEGNGVIIESNMVIQTIFGPGVALVVSIASIKAQQPDTILWP